MMGRRKSTPYLMRGPRKAVKRPTVLDPPDPRVAPLVPKPMTLDALKRGEESRSGLDPRLRPVDRLAYRWATLDRAERVGGGRLHPLEAMRLLHDGAVMGGGAPGVPEDIALFDECFRQADAEDRAIIRIWYGNGLPVETKAARLGISRATLYRRWSATLSRFHGWLRAHNLKL